MRNFKEQNTPDNTDTANSRNNSDSSNNSCDDTKKLDNQDPQMSTHAQMVLIATRTGAKRISGALRGRLPITYATLNKVSQVLMDNQDSPLFFLAALGLMSFIVENPDYLHDCTEKDFPIFEAITEPIDEIKNNSPGPAGPNCDFVN